MIHNFLNSNSPNWLGNIIKTIAQDVSIENWLQWGITLVTVILTAILGYLGGIHREKHNRKIKKDQQTFEELLQILKPDKMRWVRSYITAEKIKWDRLEPLEHFTGKCENHPQFIFIDKKLEKLRINLYEAIGAFFDFVNISTKAQPMPGISDLPREEEIGQKQFIALANKIQQLAESITNSYDELVKTAQRKL